MFNKFKQKIADGVEGVSAGRQTPLSRVQKNGEKNEPDEVLHTENKRVSIDSGAHVNSTNSTFEALLGETTRDIHNGKIKSSPQEVLARVHHLIEVGRAQAQNNGRIDDNENCDGSVDGSLLENNSFNRDESYMTSTPLDITQEEDSQAHPCTSDIPLHSKFYEHLVPSSEGPICSSSEQTPAFHKNTRQKQSSSNRCNSNGQDERVYVDGNAESSPCIYDMSHDELCKLYHKQDKSLRRCKQKFSEVVEAYKTLQKEKEKTESDSDEDHNVKGEHGEMHMEGVIYNINELLKEQEDLQAQVAILRDELKNRDSTVMKMRREEASSEERLRSALKQQEVELQMLFEEKESHLKNLFADKVHDLQRVMEENEKQKKISLYQKDSDVMRTKDELSILREQLNESNEKDTRMKTKVQKIISEKEVSDKKFSECQQQLEHEKEKQADLILQHAKQMKEVQDELYEQLSKVKRMSQTKVYDAQDQLRKKTNDLNEMIEKHKIQLDAKVKESTQFMQSEHAKASRKLEVKISDMKKMIKELRQKLTEKEGYCTELEVKLQDAKVEAEQAKSLNSSLEESEQKVSLLNHSIEALNKEINEWKKKYQEACECNKELSVEKTRCNEQIMEKDMCIKELLNMANEEKLQTICNQLEEEKEKCVLLTNERDTIHIEMQQMMDIVKEDENTLQCELNNLKTKFSFVEDESKELTQQLHNKVSEIELLGKTLDTVNKRLVLKDDHLKETCKSFDELQAKYELLVEEKQQFEYKHNEAIWELEESRDKFESKLKEEYELKLHKKDEEFRNQLNNLQTNKESSVEVVTTELEAMYQQQLLDTENQYELQLNELQDNLNLKINAIEDRHREYVELNEEEKTKLLSDHKELVRKLEHNLLFAMQGNATFMCEKTVLVQKLESLSAKDEQDNIEVGELQKQIREIEGKHTLHFDELTYKQQCIENRNEIKVLEEEVEESDSRLKGITEQYAYELHSLRSRENETRSQLEQCKIDYLNSQKIYENKVKTFQMKELEDKCIIKASNDKILSLELKMNEKDAKISELLTRKCELEQELSTNKQIVVDKIRHLDTLDDTHGKNNTLFNLKNETEMKINELIKENREQDYEIDKLEGKIGDLEAKLKEQDILHEEEMSRILEEYQNTSKSASEKFNSELMAVNDELLVKCEKVIQLEERLDNVTVEKMNALSAQKVQLEKEYNDKVNKMNEGNKKQMNSLEMELRSTIEEKEFQYNSEAKSMKRHFQSQMANKDMEMQKTLHEANEVSQQTLVDARKDAEITLKEALDAAQQREVELISKYNHQIADLQNALHIQEENMLALQIESRQQIDLVREERDISEKKHTEEYKNLELDSQKQLGDLSKLHEQFLEDIAHSENAYREEEECKLKNALDTMEENYKSKAKEIEENYKDELLAQEKKYKSRLKQAKLEMQKLLAHNVGDDSHLIDFTSDNCGSQGPASSIKNDRPMVLHIPDNHNASLEMCDNLDEEVPSQPKSPQLMEYEYLRNILYNYMMGKQRKQMAKVLTAIVHFSPSQVQEILTKVEEQEAHKEKKNKSWL